MILLPPFPPILTSRLKPGSPPDFQGNEPGLGFHGTSPHISLLGPGPCSTPPTDDIPCQLIIFAPLQDFHPKVLFPRPYSSLFYNVYASEYSSPYLEGW